VRGQDCALPLFVHPKLEHKDKRGRKLHALIYLKEALFSQYR